MVNPQSIPTSAPAFGRLKTANHLRGDRDGLDRAWERDGYWYFKGVLDTSVIADMRADWIDYLKRHGVIDPGVNENRYNRQPGDVTRDSLQRIGEFNQNDQHRKLTENPTIVATVKEILGDDPFWLPIAEYRANLPGDDPDKSRFIYPHQDGFYSRGMPMKICWIPIDRVDPELGGCAWIGGAHRGPILHDLSKPPLFPIPTDVVPMEGWLTAEFEPGDLMIFDLNTPHSGLTNLSKDRFRMSMDIRVTEASGPTPVIGSLVSLSEQQVVVRNDRTDRIETFAITPETYVRSTDGRKREGEALRTTFQPGEQVIVNALDGRTATLVRSVH